MCLITLPHVYTPNQARHNADSHQFIVFKSVCYLKSTPVNCLYSHSHKLWPLPPPVQSSSPRVKVTVYLTRDVTSADEQFGKANTVKLCFSEYSVSEPGSKKKKKGKEHLKTFPTNKTDFSIICLNPRQFFEAGCDKTNQWKRFIRKSL